MCVLVSGRARILPQRFFFSVFQVFLVFIFSIGTLVAPCLALLHVKCVGSVASDSLQPHEL